MLADEGLAELASRGRARLGPPGPGCLPVEGGRWVASAFGTGEERSRFLPEGRLGSLTVCPWAPCATRWHRLGFPSDKVTPRGPPAACCQRSGLVCAQLCV